MSSNGARVLFWLGLSVLVLWLLRNLLVIAPTYGHGIAGMIGAFVGGTLADIRVWLLAVPLYLLYRRMNKASGKAP
jgi:hypothetical protein